MRLRNLWCTGLLVILAACSTVPAGVTTNNEASISTDSPQPTHTQAVTELPTATTGPTSTLPPTLPPSATPLPSQTPAPTPTSAFALAPSGEIQPIPHGLVYLGDPDTLALGFNMNAGGAIASLLYEGRELVDRTDYGRYIQLSFYDGYDHYGSSGKDPYGKWGWNPIQAGSKAGGGLSVGAKVLEYRTGKDSVYIKAQGIEWGKNEEHSDVIFETWAWQRQGYFEIYTIATHFGEDHHGPATQEYPAAYFAKSLTHMVSYFGAAPFTAAAFEEINHVAQEGEIAGLGSCPFVYPSENWAAYSGDDGVGLILAVPPQKYLETRWNFCRLYDIPLVGYIGPLAYFDVPPQAVRAITYYLIPGPIESARGIVYSLVPHTTWTFDLNSLEGWESSSSQATVENGIVDVQLSPEQFLTSGEHLRFAGAIAPTITIHARTSVNSDLCLQYTTAKDQEWSANKAACIQLAPGAFQKKSFVLNENPAWDGAMITRLRFYSSADASVKIDEIQVDLKGQAWEFENEGDVEGWLPWHQLDPLQASQGILETRATGNDPYMGSPLISLEAEKHTFLTVRMAISTGRSAQLFFLTADDPNFYEAKSTAFTINADGNFHTYTLDLSTVAGWKGIVTQIRLDPTDARASIQVDYIRIQEP